VDNNANMTDNDNMVPRVCNEHPPSPIESIVRVHRELRNDAFSPQRDAAPFPVHVAEALARHTRDRIDKAHRHVTRDTSRED